MASFGDIAVTINNNNVGMVRVLSLYPGPALFPQLCFTLSLGLQNIVPIDGRAPLPMVVRELIDLRGQISFAAGSEIIGSLQWIGDRDVIRSSPAAYEQQFRMSCDLDHVRLEQIEKKRNGRPLQLFMELWPTIVVGQERQFAQIGAFRLDIPREAWIEFLKSVHNSEFDVFEIQYGPGERDSFKRGLERMRDARDKFAVGEYDEAVGLCRLAIEAAGHEVKQGEGLLAFGNLFTRVTDEKRGKAYSAITTQLKQLGANVHHDYGSPLTYSRAEAQFVLRSTESLLMLASHFVRMESASRSS